MSSIGKTMVSAPLGVAGEYPSHEAALGKGGIHIFMDTKSRDAMWDSLKVDNETIALVKDGDNKYPSWYIWTGTQWDFAGYFGGMVLADVDGALTRIESTAVFGPDFKIQAAGDVGNGVLLMLSDEVKADIAKQVANGSGLITIGTYQKPATFSKGDTIEVEWPLKAWPDADKQKTIRVSMDHAAFEPLHPPAFGAYISVQEAVVGGTTLHEKHHDGKLWFDSAIWGADNPYITVDRVNKSYGIEEADNLDPNVTGGTDYLVAAIINMIGVAPEDGSVRMYFYDHKVTPFSETGYLSDVNGEPLVVERAYKQGDKLGALELASVINAKGQREFNVHVTHTFSDDTVTIADAYRGVSGILIQAMTKRGVTSLPRLQFEQDSGVTFRINKQYLGPDRATLSYMTQRNIPMADGSAGMGMTQNDGWHFYNLSPMKVGVQDGHVVFRDNGADICDFNFGKIFPSEETLELRGKIVTVTSTITDKNCGWNISLFKWKGKPNQYSDKIFTGRQNVNLNMEQGWEKDSTFFISEDVVHGDHTVTHDFTVPADANNYAIIIYPSEPQQPMTLNLKELKVDVKVPVNAYALGGIDYAHEKHLVYSDQYKEFVQNTQGYASLRYTINAEWTPMPIGIASKGYADVSLDTTVNQVAGSSAKGGEGALRFNTDGTASGYIDIYVYNEQGTDNNFTFALCDVDADTGVVNADPLDNFAVVTGTVPAHSKGMLVRMHILPSPIKAGDRWALVAKSGKSDGAYIQCSSNTKPMVKTAITFNEFVAAP